MCLQVDVCVSDIYILICARFWEYSIVKTSHNKAVAMKPPSAVASSSFDASSCTSWSLVFLHSLKMTTEGEDGGSEGRSRFQTSVAVLLTAACPFVWTQVRCEIRPAHPKLSFCMSYMCCGMKPHTIFVHLQTWLVDPLGLVTEILSKPKSKTGFLWQLRHVTWCTGLHLISWRLQCEDLR